jgi:hypothetical protein
MHTSNLTSQREIKYIAAHAPAQSEAAQIDAKEVTTVHPSSNDVSEATKYGDNAMASTQDYWGRHGRQSG